MITISIVNLYEVVGAEGEVAGQHVDVIVSDGNQSYFVSRGDLPAGITHQQVQTWLDNRAQAVWDYAVANGRPPNLFGQVSEHILLEAFATWVTKKLNALHQVAGLPLLTRETVVSELRQEVIDKVAE